MFSIDSLWLGSPWGKSDSVWTSLCSGDAFRYHAEVIEPQSVHLSTCTCMADSHSLVFDWGVSLEEAIGTKKNGMNVIAFCNDLLHHCVIAEVFKGFEDTRRLRNRMRTDFANADARLPFPNTATFTILQQSNQLRDSLIKFSLMITTLSSYPARFNFFNGLTMYPVWCALSINHSTYKKNQG